MGRHLGRDSPAVHEQPLVPADVAHDVVVVIVVIIVIVIVVDLRVAPDAVWRHGLEPRWQGPVGATQLLRRLNRVRTQFRHRVDVRDTAGQVVSVPVCPIFLVYTLRQ